MPDLRWTLLILGVLFVAALAWWELRKPRQAARGGVKPNPPAEETKNSAPARAHAVTPNLPELRAREPVPSLPVFEVEGRTFDRLAAEDPEPEGVFSRAGDALPPFGDGVVSLSAPGATGLPGVAADRAPPFGDEFAAELPPAESPAQAEAAARASGSAIEAARARPALPPASIEDSAASGHTAPGEQPASAGSSANGSQAEGERHILALRLVSSGNSRFLGRAVRQALAAEGFMLGKFAIFHKAHDDERTLLSAAGLTQPGTFELASMDTQRVSGLSLFAVLPGPLPASLALEQLLASARSLNDRLQGALQDERGAPLTTSRIASLREQAAALAQGGAESPS